MLEYDNNYIRRLIQLDLVGGLSPAEKGKLEDWINESEEGKDVRSSSCPSAYKTEVVEICRSGTTRFIIHNLVVCLERENGK